MIDLCLQCTRIPSSGISPRAIPSKLFWTLQSLQFSGLHKNYLPTVATFCWPSKKANSVSCMTMAAKALSKKSKWLLGLDKLISDYQRSSKKRKNHLKTPKRISYQVYFVKEEIRCLQCLKQTFYSLPFLLIIGHQFLVSLYFCYIKLYLGFCFLFVLYLNQKYFCKENFCTLWKFWYQIASNNTLPSSLPPLTSNSQPSTCTWAIPLYL